MSQAFDIELVDVSARDGLQNEPNAKYLSAQDKVDFIRKLAQSGLKRIEAGSFVRPQAVPAMANSTEVGALLAPLAEEFPGVVFSYLVPNLKGLERAKAINAKEVAIFLSVSEKFSHANINVGVDEAFTAIEPTIKAALESGMRVRGYISNIFGYTDLPFSPHEVAKRSKQLLDMGCYEVSLGDTTALGTPDIVEPLFAAHEKLSVPFARLAGHFHDTLGNAVSNAAKAYELGIRTFDAATGGLGGCPFANSPKGNMALEDLVAWAQKNNHSCAVKDIRALETAAAFIHSKLNEHNTRKDNV